MHTTIEELRSLADAYVKKEILDDKRLMLKKHMAKCDECYKKFCAIYLIQKELYTNAFLPNDDFNEKQESLITGIIMQISKVKDMMNTAKLTLSLQNAFLKDENWDFRRMQHLAVARGSKEIEIYQNINSKESRILYENDMLIIELDEEKYKGNELYLLIIDGENQQRIDFIHDEDMELYRAVVELGQYSEDVIINIKK